jgi:DNA-binding Xre family transcriptional regulator
MGKLTMEHKLDAISSQLNEFMAIVKTVLSEYPNDKRKLLLEKTLEILCQCIECQSHLIMAETEGRLLIQQHDYHKILEAYLLLFREIKTLPRARSGSVYEIGLVSCLDRIVKSYCLGEEVE